MRTAARSRRRTSAGRPTRQTTIGRRSRSSTETVFGRPTLTSTPATAGISRSRASSGSVAISNRFVPSSRREPVADRLVVRDHRALDVEPLEAERRGRSEAVDRPGAQEHGEGRPGTHPRESGRAAADQGPSPARPADPSGGSDRHRVPPTVIEGDRMATAFPRPAQRDARGQARRPSRRRRRRCSRRPRASSGRG